MGALIFGAKLTAWRLTGSSALLSDALESIVNVVAALFALFALRFASRPADRDHPYGHGKIEFVSAAFEGGLVGFAALAIAWTAARALWLGPRLRDLDAGLVVAGAAALANLGLGGWLLRTGRRTRSPTLIADGKHVLADVWTTAGALGGLVLVKLTGLRWLDPVAALIVGLLVAREGVHLVLTSLDGLLDREDPDLLRRLVEAFNRADVPGITDLHRLRAIRSGDHVHVDAHVYVPAAWSVEKAHDAAERLEEQMKAAIELNGEIVLHLDPDPRAEPRPRRPLTVEQAVRPFGAQ
jgi:cation diffusion facilitator family transporter